MAKAAKKDPVDELEDTAVADFISAAGMAKADAGAVKSALRDFVYACMQRYEAAEVEKDE